jgi:hypothetical protein
VWLARRDDHVPVLDRKSLSIEHRNELGRGCGRKYDAFVARRIEHHSAVLGDDRVKKIQLLEGILQIFEQPARYQD